MAETIAAICTPMTKSAIGIIRISGDNAISVAGKVFSPVAKSIDKMQGYTATYGHIFDEKGEFDDGVLTVFRAPHSYTGEDVVEISLHGGSAVMKRALRSVINAGAKMAGGGEFTKRAFMNGKMSLTEAEAVMDIISAENNDALQCAVKVKNGAIYKKINDMCQRLTLICASVTQYIDFPEEGEQYYDTDGFLNDITAIFNELQKLIEDFDNGAKIRHGIDCTIVGKPNVGKSTLMNLLSNTDRSIVTSIAGTTRDIVEETIELDGLTLNLSDTAGIRKSDDIVEAIGIDKAKQRIKDSQLILAVFAADEPISEEDFDILEQIKDQPHLIVLNKTDLNCGVLHILQKYGKVIEISAKEHIGIDELKHAILSICGALKLDENSVYLANERQLNMATDAKNALNDAIFALNSGLTLDAVSVTIESAIESLLKLSGERVSDTVIAQVFENFCVGK